MMTQPQLFNVLAAVAGEKEYAQITVTDLCREAGISRMTFYRSYDSIDDIVIERIKTVFASYGSSFTLGAFDGQRAALGLFRQFRSHQDLLSLLNAGNLSALLEKEIESFLVMFSASRVQSDCSEGDTRISFDQAYMAGGISRVLLRWAQGGMKESEDYMAQIVGEHLPTSMNAISITEEV